MRYINNSNHNNIKGEATEARRTRRRAHEEGELEGEDKGGTEGQGDQREHCRTLPEQHDWLAVQLV